MGTFFKKFRGDVQAIGFLGLVVFLSLALVSYNPKDISFNSAGHGLKTLNYCGVIGSFVADLLYQVLGVSAWLVVLGLFVAAIRNFQGKEIQFRSFRMLWMALLIFACSALLAVYWPQVRLFENKIFAGGLMGIGLSSGLIKIANPIGTQVVLWAMSLMLTVFCFEVSLRSIIYRALEQAKFLWLKFWNAFKAQLSKTGRMAAAEVQKVNEENKPTGPRGRAAALFAASNSIAAQTGVTQSSVAVQDQDEKTSGMGEDRGVNEEVVQVSPYEPPARRKIVLNAKTTSRVENWSMPKLSLLEDPPLTRIKIDEKEIRRKADITIEKLKQFGVNGQITAAKPGPAVTMFEFRPNVDARVNKVTELADDLALALSAESLRIIAPIPGRDVIGIETSNAQRETVYLKDLLADETFWADEIKLPIALGKQTNGEPRIVDLRKMPHLLIAGTTGSGKSVFTVATITGFLFKHSPKTLRLILVDPKQVDLAAFADIPHLIMPPIRDPKKAVTALRWAVKEMEKRYKSMSLFGARNIEQFNEAIEKLSVEQAAEHEKVNLDFEKQGGVMKLEQYYYTPRPYIVIAVEEFGDLMAVDKQNVEQNIVRLAQMARACGIHLMLAMQSPRKEVVTGLIKTNIPGRISFKVASKMDSRIILDEQGAERLLAQGDMLVISAGASKAVRHHGPFLKESEINGVAKFWSDQGQPDFDPLALRALEGASNPSGGTGTGGSGGKVEMDFLEEGSADGLEDEYDERYDEILAWAAEQKAVSASLIQRRFKLGYPRAARLIEIFEKEGVVGPANGSKPRAVLVSSHQSS